MLKNARKREPLNEVSLIKRKTRIMIAGLGHTVASRAILRNCEGIIAYTLPLRALKMRKLAISLLQDA